MQFEEPAESPGDAAAENKRLKHDLAFALAERDRLTRELEQATGALQNAKQELQDFVYAASHDLKEPLRSISSYTQLLQRHGSDPEQLAEYSRFVVEGVAAATKLLEQLLRLSRAGANPRRLPVSLRVPLQAALFRLQPLIAELAAEVAVETLPEFSVDEGQFAQMFEIVLDNALKYHGAERPNVSVSGEETDAGVLLAVRDNGVGIAPEFRTHVFKPFKRLHGREIPGTGLGLAIGRRIVEAHEGRIWVEGNGDDPGTTVKILLPY
jgi:signal transduction histidine kinase